jgi:lipopolysaccharide export LptBFGC system permease protein LptF
MKPATLLTTVVLLLIALAHVLRLILGTEVTVAGRTIPMWASAAAVIFFAALAMGLWREKATAVKAAV